MKKRITAMCLVCLLAFLIVGCQKSTDDSKDADTASEATASGGNTGSIPTGSVGRLTKWIVTNSDGQQEDMIPYLETDLSEHTITFIDEFEPTDGITVKYTNVLGYYPDGSGPLRLKSEDNCIEDHEVILWDTLGIGNQISHMVTETYEDGREVTEIDEYTYDGNVMRMTIRDDSGELYKTEETVFDEHGYAIKYSEYDKNNNMESTTEYINEYNDAGKLVRRTWESYGNDTGYGSSESGKTYSGDTGSFENMKVNSSAMEHIIEIEYDSSGRMIKATESRSVSNGVELLKEVIYTYNDDGRIIKTTERSMESGADNEALSDPVEYGYEYDALGRLIKTVNPDGSINEFVYE